MSKKNSILGVFAHPDDETFGPGATLAKYASQGYEVSVITATRGQAGQTSNSKIINTVGGQRENELRKAAKILGIKNVFILDFFDGTLNEHQLPLLKKMVAEKVNQINPEIIIVYELSGISYHLDHIAVTKAVLQLYDEKKILPKKIYYFGLPEKLRKSFGLEGGLTGKNIVKVDIKDFWPIKIRAMKVHRTQQKDWQRMLGRFEAIKKEFPDLLTYDFFKLAKSSPNTQYSNSEL